MKELSIEEKAQRYKEAIDRAIKHRNNDGLTLEQYETIDLIFPELMESEDERIRKEIIAYFKADWAKEEGITRSDWIAWLEKQDSEPNWCHHKVDLSNCSEEYRKAYYDGWNNCNQQHSQCKSEGNDVVKCLINGMKFYYNDNEEATWGTEKFSMKVKDILSWLEKQGKNKSIDDLTQQEAMDISVAKCFGEQKSTDNIEPKFEVGNWYQCTKDFFGKGVTFDKNTAYYCAKEGCLQDEYGCHIAIVKDLYDNFKLWTIQDAKDGDVLATLNHILIFEKFLPKDGGVSYCHYDFGCSTPQFNFNKDDNWYFGKEAKVYPATKEQRSALMKAMADAGYTFDFEKKELRKLEPTDKIGRKFKVGDIVQYITDSTDRRKIKEIGTLCNMYHTDSLPIMFEAEDEWKVVVNAEDVEQEPAWSEEDERNLNDAILFIETGTYSLDKDSLINWLKSLRPQKQWKPSEEQIEILDMVLTDEAMDDNVKSILKELKEQLKKLREK